MLAYPLKPNSIFKSTIVISILGHSLFFYGIFFTFNKQLDKSMAVSASFLGPILGKGDLKVRTASKKTIALNTVYRVKPSKSDSSNLSSSYKKPLYPAGELPLYAKQLNKFLVFERKVDISDKLKQKGFEPPSLEKVKLRLKTE